MTRKLMIMFVLFCAIAVNAASEPEPPFFPKHGVPHLKLDEKVSFEIQDQIFWSLHFMPDKALSSGVIYYEHYRLQESKMRRISLSMSSVTVRMALDALVKLDGTYSWEADGDVVNFLPKKKNKKVLDPIKTLNQVMPIFEVENVDIRDAVQELKKQALAQGIKGLLAPELDWRSRAKDVAWEWEGLFSLKLKNKTIRECLNAIVASDPPAYWQAVPFLNEVSINAVPSHTHTGKLRNPSKQ